MKGRKKKWITWVVAAVMLVLFSPVLMLAVNQVKGQGVSFTNLKTWIETKRLLKEYIGEEYEDALARIDLESVYKNHKEIKQMSEDYTEYNQNSLDNFSSNAKKLKDAGYQVVDYKLKSVKEGNISKWELTYELTIEYNGTTYTGYTITLMGDKGKYLVKQISNPQTKLGLYSQASQADNVTDTFEGLFMNFGNK